MFLSPKNSSIVLHSIEQLWWEQPTKVCWHCTCGTRGLAVSEVWPRAGRVAAHPWMTRPTRPEGTDNGQSLLTLHLCQNVSTFNNVTSTPYMVKHRQRITILWSRELWIGYWWRSVVSRPGQAALNLWPKALSSSMSPVDGLPSLTHIQWLFCLSFFNYKLAHFIGQLPAVPINSII